MTNRQKEIRYVKKAKKLQAIREGNGEWVNVGMTRLILWVKKGEDKEEKIRQFKEKLSKSKYKWT